MAVEAPIAEIRKARRGAFLPLLKNRRYEYEMGAVPTHAIMRLAFVSFTKIRPITNDVRNASTIAPNASPLPRNGRYAIRSRATAPTPEMNIAARRIKTKKKTSVAPVRYG